MPTTTPDLITQSRRSAVTVSLEPVQNAVYSMVLLSLSDSLSGLDEWVDRTLASMAPDLRHRNKLVSLGLHYAVVPDASWPSVPEYLDHFKDLEPRLLRDRILSAYGQIDMKTERPCTIPDPARKPESLDVDALLANVDTFLAFLGERFSPDHIDEEIESEAHRYLQDPPAMRELIVNHLRYMWEEVLSPEWNRQLPKLQASVTAFQRLDLGGLGRKDAVLRVLGDHAEEQCWKDHLGEVDRVILVPSPHLGPYLGRFEFRKTLWLLFGARTPDSVPSFAPDLSRAEMFTRIAALADDTRLRILKLLADEGEKKSVEIMERLELSQSATSRHLKHLCATSFLNERRCNGAKCYELNGERIDAVLQSIATFLRRNH
jgi:hypothetical protein